MEQVVVPQFLDVEDKVIGPITVRQFIELIIGGLLIFIFYRIFDTSLFIVSGLTVLSITIIVAFARINGQSFHYFLLNFLATLRSPKLKVWKRTVSMDEIRNSLKKGKEIKVPVVKMARQPISSSKISELALIIDTGGVYTGER
jgi:hypothetical protein